jgi:hypothetical protein
MHTNISRRRQAIRGSAVEPVMDIGPSMDCPDPPIDLNRPTATIPMLRLGTNERNKLEHPNIQHSASPGCQSWPLHIGSGA